METPFQSLSKRVFCIPNQGRPLDDILSIEDISLSRGGSTVLRNLSLTAGGGRQDRHPG